MIDIIGNRERHLHILFEMLDLMRTTIGETTEATDTIRSTINSAYVELQEFQNEYDEIDSELKNS